MAIVRPSQHKRMTLILLITVLIAGAFWATSRYPNLNQKAAMGGSALTEDPLTFNAVIQSQPADSRPRKIGISTVNWLAENRQGMTFGVLLGGCFLTLFGLFQTRGTKSAFANALIGIGVGAPLGVCVNCAAPIAKGLHESGARIETTLSTMFASPTMNIVVVTMMFSMLPMYLIAIKMGLTLLFLLAVIPLLSRSLFRNEAAPTYDDAVCPMPPPSFPANESWAEAARGCGREYGRNLWYIAKKTVPLMFLAGFLAAVAVHLIPIEEVAGLPVGALSLVAAALFGLFLPMPIGLDVVMAAAMLAGGIPMAMVGTLLFTLGIYSIYSFGIIWNTMSARVAVTLAVILTVFGLVAAGLAEYGYQRDMQMMMESLDDFS